MGSQNSHLRSFPDSSCSSIYVTRRLLFQGAFSNWCSKSWTSLFSYLFQLSSPCTGYGYWNSFVYSFDWITQKRSPWTKDRVVESGPDFQSPLNLASQFPWTAQTQLQIGYRQNWILGSNNLLCMVDHVRSDHLECARQISLYWCYYFRRMIELTIQHSRHAYNSRKLELFNYYQSIRMLLAIDWPTFSNYWPQYLHYWEKSCDPRLK